VQATSPDSSTATIKPEPHLSRGSRTAFGILAALSVSHMLNDMLQALLPAIYPILKTSLRLDFRQIGLITLTNQITASVLQPVVGLVTDRRPQPYSLAVGMSCTLAGMLILPVATQFPLVLLAAALIGLGSAVFHPESSRIARLASGGRHGLAQSVFQVGGNFGTSLGPLLAAFIVLPRGQSSISWFALAALVAIVLLVHIGTWYKRRPRPAVRPQGASIRRDGVSSRQATAAIALLLGLIFSKYVYMAAMTSYYTFYLIDRFGLSVRDAQLHLFLFLGAVAAGTIVGGPIGDRIGRRRVILWSIVGVLPFTLLLPHVSLFWVRLLSVPIGMTLASAFPAIIVYAHVLLPGRVGMVAGLFFGIAFGIGGMSAAALGMLADTAGITFVFDACSFLPALGLLALRLPHLERRTGTAP
jgi:FSR family fosmidomycin resistance protein-like MFS transporter